MNIYINSKNFLSLKFFRKCIILYWALQHIRILQINRFPIITYIIVGWAFLLCFQYSNKIWSNIKKYYLLLFIFLGGYFITCLLNYNYMLIDNVQLIVWEFVQFFILTCYRTDDANNKKEIESLMRLFIIYTFIFSFCSLLMFWLNINGIAKDYISGEEFRYGYRNGRLFGMYGSPNYGALFSVISIVFSNFFKSKNLKKYFYKLNIIIQILYLIMSSSRTGIVAFIIGFIMQSVWNYCKQKENITCKSLINGVIIGLFKCMLVILLFEPIKNVNISLCNKYIAYQQSAKYMGIDKPTQSNNAVGSSHKNNVMFNAKPKIQNSRDDISNLDISNGRFLIWKNALDTFFISKPIFGVTQLGYMKYGKKHFPSSYIITNNKFSLHNDFITILTCSGLMGFVWCGTFFLIYFYKIIPYCIKILCEKEKKILEWTVCTTIIVCFATMFFSDAIILNITTESLLFWSLTGYIFTRFSIFKEA